MENVVQYVVGMDFNFRRCRAWIVPVFEKNDNGSSLLFTNFTTSDHIYEWQIDEGFLSCGFKDFFPDLHFPDALFQNDFYSFLTSNPLHFSGYCKILEELVERLQSCNSVLKSCSCEWCFYIPPFMYYPIKRRFKYIEIVSTALSRKGINVNHFISSQEAIKGVLDYLALSKESKSSLFIHYGASTIETSLWEKGENTNSFISDNLGASQIERAILSYYKCNNPDNFNNAYEHTNRLLCETGNNYVDLSQSILYIIKKQKEDCYRSATSHFYLDFNFGRFVGLIGIDNPFRPYSFEFCGDLDAITEDYQNAVHDYFKELSEQIGAYGIKRIILSGGACNMGWVWPMVKTVFPEAEIVGCRHPSYVLVRGTAYYVRNKLLQPV